MTLVHDTAPTDPTLGGQPQAEPQLELQSDGLDMVLTFKDAEEKEQWKQSMYNSKMHLQEEELKKTSNRPRRRATKASPDGTPREGDGATSARGRPLETNLLKTVGGGGLKKTAANIEAFRSKNLNSTSITHISYQEKDNLVIGEAESESAAVAKLQKAVDVEEEKKDKLAKEIAEIEESVAKLQSQLAAQQAKNAELERSINEARAKGGRSFERRN